jgi:regulator of sigma E protease
VILDGVIDVLILLAVLVGLVLVHELGHFLMARRAGVIVHEFGVGFPPRAAILHRGKETIYSLNWLPIGGFVRLEGEEGESLEPRAFVNQRLRTRLGILLAGVVVNFVLAWVIFSAIALFADPVLTTRIASVESGSPADRAGLMGGQPITLPDGGSSYDESGDLILAIDGRRFAVFDDMDTGTDGRTYLPGPLRYLRQHAGQEVTLTIRRAGGEVEDITVTLRTPTSPEQGALGVSTLQGPQEDRQNGLLESVVIGFERTVDASLLIVQGVAQLVGSLVSGDLANAPVAGPVGIAGVVGDVRAELPPVYLLWLVGLLSANLAVINVLPFPPMDGGRVAMALVQAVSRNRVSPQAERLVYLTGFVMLMALLVWVTALDIGRLGS